MAAPASISLRAAVSIPMADSRLSDPRFKPVVVSLLVSVLMLGGKVSAYVITGSAAIFSDAAESVVHILATGVVAISIWYSLKPADADHPYGHGKAAYFSAGFEGGLIMLAAGVIIYSAIIDLIRGPELQQLGVGLVVLLVLTLINLTLGLYLVRKGKRYNNLALVANGRHVLTDMWTSIGVIVGVGLVLVTDILWLDPVVAIAVALNILFTAFQLIKKSFEGLMEKSDDEDTRAILAVLDNAVVKGAIAGYHQLRHRQTGSQRWIEYHLLFQDDVSLSAAHTLSHEVEEQLVRVFGGDEVVVTAHLEPAAHDKAHPRGHVEPADPLTELRPE